MDLSIKKLIGLALGLYLVAYLLPAAITAIEGTNTTTWGTGTAGVWTVVGIVSVIGIVYMVWRSASRG